MQHFAGEALALTALPHGEHGAVVRFLTFDEGLRSGYVAGGRGKAKRALLHPGNRLWLRLRARDDNALPSAELELLESRALLSFEPVPAAILSWLAALLAAVLAERAPQPRLAAAFDALLAALGAGLAPTAARAAMARFELLLLKESGFGLDLAACALGGDRGDLAFVSPNSGRAVSRAKALGQPWAGRLLPLPPFLIEGGAADEQAVAEALALSGHFLRLHWESAMVDSLRARAVGRISEGALGRAGGRP